MDRAVRAGVKSHRQLQWEANRFNSAVYHEAGTGYK
jgi:hypothetical protein